MFLSESIGFKALLAEMGEFTHITYWKLSKSIIYIYLMPDISGIAKYLDHKRFQYWYTWYFVLNAKSSAELY